MPTDVGTPSLRTPTGAELRRAAAPSAFRVEKAIHSVPGENDKRSIGDGASGLEGKEAGHGDRRPPADLEGGGMKPCDAGARPCVFIFKTVNEPRVGMVSYFKVYAGVS